MPLDAEQFADVVAVAIQSATAPLLARIAALETRNAIAGRDGRDGTQGPAGEKGIDGKDGAPGRDGAPGERGERGDVGAQGEPGPAGERGPEGPAGRDGINGKDGAPGLHGKDGADGRDGLNGTLENLKVVQSADLRTISLCFKSSGEPIDGGTFRLPVVLDRGDYQPDVVYQEGDQVTSGGSLWIARGDTSTMPGTSNPSWRLGARRGRDGKRGQDGRDLRNAPVVSIGGRL